MLYFLLIVAIIVAVQLFGYKRLYKVIGRIKAVALTLCIGTIIILLSICYNHLTVEKQLEDWKMIGMDIYHKAYVEAESRGLDSVNAEKHALKVLNRQGYERPGSCIYCRIRSWNK